jgi:HlyD family secretion protein
VKTTGRRLLLGAFLAALLGVSLYAFLPRPIAVETATVGVGPLAATIDEEGRTRARDRYTIAAPTAGDLERVTLRAGDLVKRGQVLAVIHLSQLDPREREAALGKLRAAEALRREAEALEREARENAARAAAEMARATADAEQAARDRERAEQLHAKGYIPLQELEQARSGETAARSAEASSRAAAEAARRGAEAAHFRVEAAKSEVAVAQAALLAGEEGADDERRRLTMRAPVDGRVLRVLEESERVVAAGTPIVEVGDPTRLEVVIEVLSSDAVRVRPGMPVRLEGWGGERPLMASVRTVEPAAFTKVSALGVEEQRVNVVADIAGAPADLGDGYRVEARIVTWAADAVLKVPASALFRDAATAAGGSPPAGGPGWAVFAVAEGRAQLRRVEVGHRTAAEAEITAGLGAGDRVVLHPPNELRDGVRVTSR